MLISRSVAVLSIVSCLFFCDASRAAEVMTPNTVRLAPGENSPCAAIELMAWIAGTWRGVAAGAESEEIWSMPNAGTMLGMYRMTRDARPVFYELLALTEESGSLVLRLKHFHPDLTGWEERADSVTMPLVAVREDRIYFEGLTFEPQADDGLTIYVAIEDQTTGNIREEVFRLKRLRLLLGSDLERPDPFLK
jgi:hypothetical protein